MCLFVLHYKIRRHDLGDDVLLAVVERPDLTLLVVNHRGFLRRWRRFLDMAPRLPIRQRQDTSR